jgi:hypothetical protein
VTTSVAFRPAPAGTGKPCRELGAAHFDRADAHKIATRVIRRLHQTGCAAQVTPM